MTVPPGACMLDVGCGPGWFWCTALPRLPAGLRLTLTDASNGMIETARLQKSIADHTASLAFAVAEAAALPFKNASFDAVVAMHMLYHVVEPRRALHEMRRILRPGGRIHVSTNGTDNMRELGDLSAMVFGGPGSNAGAARFSMNDAERLLGDVFDDVRRHDFCDLLEVTDPDDVVAYLLSMQSGDKANAKMREQLRDVVHTEATRQGGTLRLTKRMGFVEGRCPA